MKRTALAGIAALTLVLTGCAGSSGSNSAQPSSGASPTGTVTIQFWHAQTDTAAKVMQQLVNSFNASHPNIVVQASSGGTSTGDLLPKVTTAIAAGTYPDVAYIYGSYAANIARRQGHRVPCPHRQPVGDLQQEAVRRGRRPRSVARLDLERLPQCREEADG